MGIVTKLDGSFGATYDEWGRVECVCRGESNGGRSAVCVRGEERETKEEEEEEEENMHALSLSRSLSLSPSLYLSLLLSLTGLMLTCGCSTIAIVLFALRMIVRFAAQSFTSGFT
jgi:hypothetical protein